MPNLHKQQMFAHSLNVHFDSKDSMHTTHMHVHMYVSQGNGTEEKVFEERQVFKECLKTLTEVA